MGIIGFGNALVDVLVQISDDKFLHDLNLPKGSMQLIDKQQVPSIVQSIRELPVKKISGGSAANTIHGLAKLGTSCGFVGKVGDDELGRFYANDLQSVGVNCSLRISANETGRAYTFVSRDAERTFAVFLGAAIEMIPDDILETYFAGYSIVHIEGYLVQNTVLLERIMQLAKNAGLEVSLDLASYNVVEANLDFLKRIIPRYVDILFANEEEAKAYTGKEPEDALVEIAGEVKIAVVKVGNRGSFIQSNKTRFDIGIIPVEAKDSTGAGDQYAAGFLHGYHSGAGLSACGKIGARLAATVIEQIGARIPDESWPLIKSEVGKILQQNT